MGAGRMLLKELKSWGCEVDKTMERFIGDEELYEACLHTVLQDKSFDKLGTALKEGQILEAFDSAHTLKGVLANLGLTPMYDIVVRIVEPLRVGKTAGLLPVYEELLRAKDVLASMLARA